MKVDVVEVDDGGERVEVEVRVQTMDGEGLRSKYPGFYFFGRSLKFLGAKPDSQTLRPTKGDKASCHWR